MLEYLWATPVLSTMLEGFTAEEMSQLADLAKRYAREDAPEHSLPVVPGKSFKLQRNLFTRQANTEAENDILARLKAVVMAQYRDYLFNAYEVMNADQIKVAIRAIPVLQTPGQRTMPHYHHTCDHVACFYLSTGEGQGSPDAQTGNGELILQDPRPMRSFPFWEKTRWVHTAPGLFVLHPAGVWHETNVFSGQGERVLIAITLRVESHNYTDLYVQA
jgi:hypothetical protein